MERNFIVRKAYFIVSQNLQLRVHVLQQNTPSKIAVQIQSYTRQFLAQLCPHKIDSYSPVLVDVTLSLS